MRADAILPLEGIPPFTREAVIEMILKRYAHYFPELGYDSTKVAALLDKMNMRDIIVFNSFVTEIMRVFTVDQIDFAVEKVSSITNAITLRFSLKDTGLTLGILHLDKDVGHILRGSFAIPKYLYHGKLGMTPRQIEDWEKNVEPITDCYWINYNHATSGRTDAMGVCHATEDCVSMWKKMQKWREVVIPNDVKTAEKLENISKKIQDLEEQRKQVIKLHFEKINKIADALELKDVDKDVARKW